MCGIAGLLVGKRTATAELTDELTRMLAPLAHRGPDGQGWWADDEAGIGLGHRRLAIVDLSSTGAQPMVSADDRWVISFNGEVYGYRDRHRLPVGLTGWAQVHGLRGETSLRERVRFDNHYIEHWSLWRDIVILLRTVAAVFRAPHGGSESDVHDPERLDFGIAATTREPDVAADRGPRRRWTRGRRAPRESR